MTAIDTLAGRRVLIVEDEVLIGLVLEDLLDTLGCIVVGNATTIEEAGQLVRETTFDVAIVDVNVGSTPVFSLADMILANGIPVIFATGMLPEALPERFRGCAVLEKPYAYANVEAMLKHAISSEIPTSH